MAAILREGYSVAPTCGETSGVGRSDLVLDVCYGDTWDGAWADASV